MFVEELTKIKESEDKAEQLQKKAKTDSKQALEEAHAKASKLLEEADVKAKDAYDHLIGEGQSTSDTQYEQYLESTRKDCATMIKKARDNQSKAVEFIAERIVKASVNN